MNLTKMNTEWKNSSLKRKFNLQIYSLEQCGISRQRFLVLLKLFNNSKTAENIWRLTCPRHFRQYFKVLSLRVSTSKAGKMLLSHLKYFRNGGHRATSGWRATQPNFLNLLEEDVIFFPTSSSHPCTRERTKCTGVAIKKHVTSFLS